MFTSGPRRWLAALFLILAGAAHAVAPPPRVIEFATADFAYSRAETLPAAGWVTHAVPTVSIKYQNVARGIDPPTVWVRYRFDRAVIGSGPVALFSDRMRERTRVYLNGVDLYRSNGGPADRSFGWHRPLFLPLPEALLHPRGNEIVYRVESAMGRPLSVGIVRVGPDAPLRAAFRQRVVLSVDGPRTIASVIAVLSVGALLFWLVRPRERVFGWLALVGLVWCLWDLQYFAYATPLPDALFWTLTVDVVFVLVWVNYGFALTFFDIPGRQRVTLWSGAAVVALIGLRETLLALDLSDRAAFLLVFPLSVATIVLLARACARTPRAENFLMVAAVTLSTGFGFHDLGLVDNAFRGATFQLQPFGGLLVFLAFGFALGRRVLVALAKVEDVNLDLQAGIAEATRNLAISEAARRTLEIARAVEGERERMMREMHDGIGSSLISALAVAERQHAPPSTLATLKRSIADLRIAVDSLEPIDGDVVMLLASLRYRMERDLRDAGMAFVWKVEAVPPLPWLDAIGALHILRILQEAIGNILSHAGAQLVTVHCTAGTHEGRDGVLIAIADNGRGFDPAENTRGRGLANMRARADALSASLELAAARGSGSRVELWLPSRQGRPATAA